MNGALVVEILKIIGAVIGLASGVYIVTWQSHQKSRIKQLAAEGTELADNPERCGRHEEAIKQLRSDFDDFYDENRYEHRTMITQLGTLSLEIAKLSRNGHGGGEKK